MLSQAIEQVTRAFYARADLDLILSSPASSRNLFAVRIASIALTGAAMSAVMMAPAINAAAWIGGVRWLSAYAVIAGLSAFATGLAVLITLGLFRVAGAKRTRLDRTNYRRGRRCRATDRITSRSGLRLRPAVALLGPEFGNGEPGRPCRRQPVLDAGESTRRRRQRCGHHRRRRALRFWLW